MRFGDLGVAFAIGLAGGEMLGPLLEVWICGRDVTCGDFGKVGRASDEGLPGFALCHGGRTQILPTGRVLWLADAQRCPTHYLQLILHVS